MQFIVNSYNNFAFDPWNLADSLHSFITGFMSMSSKTSIEESPFSLFNLNNFSISVVVEVHGTSQESTEWRTKIENTNNKSFYS